MVSKKRSVHLVCACGALQWWLLHPDQWGFWEWLGQTPRLPEDLLLLLLLLLLHGLGTFATVTAARLNRMPEPH
jgi:hypothetical protein